MDTQLVIYFLCNDSSSISPGFVLRVTTEPLVAPILILIGHSEALDGVPTTYPLVSILDQSPINGFAPSFSALSDRQTLFPQIR